MNDTFFEVPENKRKRLLPNHRYNNMNNEIQAIPNDERYRIADFDSGGAGLFSTAFDYMIFAECLRNGGEYNKPPLIQVLLSPLSMFNVLLEPRFLSKISL